MRKKLIDACKIILNTCPEDIKAEAVDFAKARITEADPERSGRISEDEYHRVLEDLRAFIYSDDTDSDDPDAVLAEDRAEVRKKFMAVLYEASGKLKKSDIQKVYEKFCPAVHGKAVRVQALSLPIKTLAEFTEELEKKL